MKTVVGKVIDLVWDFAPDAYYVRGHMAPAEAHRIITEAYEGDADGRIIPMPVAAWARWSMEIGEDGPQLFLRDYSEPGCGRFAVMRADMIGAPQAASPTPPA